MSLWASVSLPAEWEQGGLAEASLSTEHAVHGWVAGTRSVTKAGVTQEHNFKRLPGCGGRAQWDGRWNDNNDNTCYVLASVLRALCTIAHSILTTPHGVDTVVPVLQMRPKTPESDLPKVTTSGRCRARMKPAYLGPKPELLAASTALGPLWLPGICFVGSPRTRRFLLRLRS